MTTTTKTSFLATLIKTITCITLLLLSTVSWGQTTITVGSGTNQGNRYPVAPYFWYTYSQQIVLKTDVNTAGLITKLRFYSTGAALTNSNNWTIYLGHTSKTAFSSNTDWIASSAMTQVFSGIVPTPSTTAGWYEIDINDVFVYNNTDNLVIAVDENASNYTGSSATNYFRIWTTPVSNRGIYVTSDSSNPDPTAISSISGTRTSYIAQMQLELAPAPTCYSPTALSISSVTSNSASISWTAPSSAPSSGYEVYYSTANTAPTAGTTATATVPSGTSYSFSGLNGNTTYYTWVRSNCGSGDMSAWVASSSFTTLCNPVSSLPWTEGFEGLSSVSTTTFPSCWLEGTGTNWNSLSTATSSYNDPRTGSYYIGCIYGGTNDRIWTPGFQLTAGVSYDFSTFFVGDGYSGWTGEIVYNTSASASGETVIGSSFISSSTTSTSGSNYVQVKRTFVPSSSGIYLFGIRITSTNNPYSYLAFDDFKLEVSPTCYEPTALTSSSISYQTATIGWTAPTSGTSPAGYEYEVRTSGAVGSGATGLVTSGTTTAPTTSVSLTGLTGGTTYTYYVRSNCGGGDYSSWSSGTFTTTSCSVPTAVTSAAITATTATISWTAPSGSPAGYEYEVRTSGAAGSGNTGLVTSGTTTAPTVSANLTGLTAATSYSVYVRTNCYSGFNSSWTSAVTFATLCNSVTTLPFTESFEGITTGIPTCWGIAGNLASSSSYHFSSSATGQTGRGLIFNSYSSSSGSTSELITPTLDLTSLSTAELKFWFKNPTGGNFEVLISTDNGANYTSLQSSLTGQTAWLQKSYTITSYISSTVKIKFKGTSNYGSGDAYVYLDEIIVQAIPTCFNATALTSTAITYQTATIGWTAPTSGTSPAGYEYEVRTSGAAGSGATGLVTSGTTTAPTTSVSLTGLTGGTSYTYYVRSNCGGGDYSSWSSGTFTTTSCSVPTAVTSAAITATTATISWTAPSGSPAGYEYEVRTSGAAGSGNTGLVTSGTTTAPTISANLTGLTASTNYSVYVRTNCYSGFNSSWTSAATFTTQCSNVTAFPSVENFATYLPNCWQEGDLGDLTAGPSTIGSASTSDWMEDGFLNSGTTGAAKMNIDGANGSEWIISPYFTLPASAHRASYNVGATQWNQTYALTTAWESDDFVEVLVSTSNNNWTVLKTYNASNVPSHLGQTDIVDLSAFSGQTVRIAFRAFEGTSNGSADIDFFIDNFTIEQTPNTWAGTTSNSWNTASNWSLNTVPTTSDNIVINSNGTNVPVMDIDVTIPAGKSLTISGTGTLTIAPGKTLTVAGTADFGGKLVTFKSDATGSAMFGSLTGTLTGASNVTVERFIPSGKRAFRLLSPAVTTTNFISNNWQQQTHITGGASGGFDATETNNPSMFTYDNQAAQGVSGWTPIANTNSTNLTAGVGYRVLVRGDRTASNITAASSDSMNAAITLSATGTLKTGTVTLNSTSTPSINNTTNSVTNGYSLVGNPYQSAVDWNAVTKSGIDATYWAWDPNMGTTAQRGRYVSFNGTVNSVDGGVGTSNVGQFIQPGQAFFVKNTGSSAGTLTFEEAHKATTSANVFRNANIPTLAVALYDPNELAIGGYPIDATKAVFSAEYSNELGLGDAEKLEAAGENIAWFRNNTKLAIEAAAPVTSSDELVMKTIRLGANKNYTFKINTTNFDADLTPYLVDNFLNTQTQISTSEVYFANFSTTSNVASYGEDRFKIVFQTSALSTDDFANNIKLYPNPAKAGASFYLDGITEATVSVYNVVGQNIPVTVMSQGNATQVTPKTALSQGVYLVTITTAGKTAQVKWIVE